MSFYYRCMLCRTRNTFKRPLDDYIRQKKCRCCKHARFYVDKERQYRSDYCTCGGYHWTHRKGSTFCISNPNYEFNVRVMRYSEHPLDVGICIAWDNPKPATEEVPF